AVHQPRSGHGAGRRGLLPAAGDGAARAHAGALGRGRRRTLKASVASLPAPVRAYTSLSVETTSAVTSVGWRVASTLTWPRQIERSPRTRARADSALGSSR